MSSRHVVAVGLLCLLPAGAAWAQSSGEPPERNQGLWQRDTLLGDVGGARTRLFDLGISLGLQEQSEVLGNPTGGERQGVIYEGATELSLGLDFGKAFGWNGGILDVSAYQIHGRGLSAHDLDNLNLASGIEADRSTRLFELWYEQTLPGGKVAVRVGQQSVDSEFMLSQFGGTFVNSTFGWPTLPSVDLPAGGPSYPLASPAVRLKLQPTDQTTLLAAVFNGDPAAPGAADPQTQDGSGTEFRLRDGVFVIAEAAYGINQDKDSHGLPGTYKLGAWYNSERFADQHVDSLGRSLADPASDGQPRRRRGDFSVYAMVDQMLYRKPQTKDGGLGVFLRVMGAPGDRNQVDAYVDGGVTYKGLLHGRDDDLLGVAVGSARIGTAARNLDADQARFSGTAYPVRSSETVLELTYQLYVAQWWQVQPDFQYVFRPGGGIPNPQNPTRRIGDAAVLGLRTTIEF